MPFDARLMCLASQALARRPRGAGSARRWRRWVAGLSLLAALPAAAAGQAEPAPQRSDHDWALQAVRAGEIRSVAEILQRLEREFLGHVVEIELERDRGRIVYEIELLAPSGHVLELVYDARTGVLVSARGQGLSAARRQTGALGGVRP